MHVCLFVYETCVALMNFQRFPSEGLVTVVKNVIDFDQYNPELRQTLVETLQKHGIPVGSPQAVVRLGTE